MKDMCCGNDTDENKFIFSCMRLYQSLLSFSKKIKYEIKVIKYCYHHNHYYLHCSNFHIPHIPHG